MSPNAAVVEREADKARRALAAGLSIRGPGMCALTGITYRQLDYWARTDLLTPSVSEARGSGTQRRYNAADVRKALLIARLLDMGVSLQRVRDTLPVVAIAEQDGLRWLVITPVGSPVACADAQAVVDVIAETRASLVLDLEEQEQPP